MSRSRTKKWIPVLIAAVCVAAPALAATHTAKQTPPIKLGTSGGSAKDASTFYCCGGTLGSAVLYDGKLSILSNNHVLARSGSATAGENEIQPGLIDVNCSSSTANVVGTFAGNLVPLGTGNVDAAISTAKSGMVSTTGEILDIGVPCSPVQTPVVGLSVKKSGRTTGTTTGTIQTVNTSVTVQYQAGCNTGRKWNVTYTNQVTITGVSGAFSAGGDSGSFIVSNDGTPNPVALLFAGNSTTTVGNRIQDVVSAFQKGGHSFSFVGAACGGFAAENLVLGPAEAEVEWASAIKDRHESEFFAKKGVLGVGVGSDEAESFKTAIVVYVDAGQGVLPQRFPKEVEGIPVRVIPTEPFVAF